MKSILISIILFTNACAMQQKKPIIDKSQAVEIAKKSANGFSGTWIECSFKNNNWHNSAHSKSANPPKHYAVNGENGRILIELDNTDNLNQKKKPIQLDKNTEKGRITGKIITLPKKEKIDRIVLSLTDTKYFTLSIDSLGVFSTNEIEFGTYTLNIFKEEDYHPIQIKNFVLDQKIMNLGMLPLFKDPYGYIAHWGKLQNGENFHYRDLTIGKGEKRDSLETIYHSLFTKQFKDKELKFETIDLSKDTMKNSTEFWRFSIIKI